MNTFLAKVWMYGGAIILILGLCIWLRCCADTTSLRQQLTQSSTASTNGAAQQPGQPVPWHNAGPLHVWVVLEPSQKSARLDIPFGYTFSDEVKGSKYAPYTLVTNQGTHDLVVGNNELKLGMGVGHLQYISRHGSGVLTVEVTFKKM